jgi:NAD-dependent deacetylase
LWTIPCESVSANRAVTSVANLKPSTGQLYDCGVSDAARLAALLRESQPCVVLTGAGISTESGIPDFRSPSGLWAQFDPLEYATVRAFRADPRKVWEFYAPRFSMLVDAQPNDAHLALARLERTGLVRAIVTQNIDLLHSRAGSSEVVEVHGSIRTSSCPRCRRRFELDSVLRLLEEAAAPACPECGAILKPDVVFFGELLPQEAIDRAFELAREAALLLVVGSALEVHPVASVPLETLEAGGKLAIVNLGPTALDGKASIRVDGGAGEVLRAVADELAA